MTHMHTGNFLYEFLLKYFTICGQTYYTEENGYSWWISKYSTMWQASHIFSCNI